MKNKIIYIFVIIFMLMIFGTTISNAGSTGELSIETSQIVLPNPYRSKDGSIIYTIKTDYTMDELSFSHSPSTHKWSKKTLSNGDIQVTVTLPYDEIKTIAQTTSEFWLQTITDYLTVRDKNDTSIYVKKENKIKIPSIYIGTTYKATYLANESRTTTFKNVITSAPDDSESYSYIWKNFVLGSTNNEVVKITKFTKPDSKTFKVYYDTLKAGTASIYVVSPTKQKVTLLTIKVVNLKLDKAKTEMYLGETTTINVTSGSHEGAIWSSSNEDVVKISSSNSKSAEIKAIATGTATITLTSKTGSQQATCEVIVKELKLDKTEVVVNKDEKVTINVSSGENAEYKWSVSDKNIIQIENSSSTNATIIGKEVGTATVTLTAGNQTKTCTVKVQNFKLDKQTAQLVDGDTLTLNIVDGGHSGVKWKVSNTNVIKISSSSNGSVKIKALNAGTAKITATSSDGKYQTSCEITVDEELKFEKRQMEVKKGERITIRVSSGENAEYKWSVSDENIIQIETSGSNYATIIGKEVGTATVTLTVGNQTCTCNVEVEARNFKVPYKVKDKKYCWGMKTNLKREDIEKDLNIKDFKIKDKNNNVISNTEKIGTGMKLEIDNYEYVMVVQGDTSGDGKITITDVAKAQLHFVKLEELTGAYLQAADTNYSDNITITDVARLQLAFLGLIEL